MTTTPPRPRDAEGTRRRLLHAARERFARDGYVQTTVRDIAADAGVNVALINRYFDSKEGLFEACLARVAEDAGRTPSSDGTPKGLIDAVVRTLTEPPDGEQSLQLLLLLRSSGDDRADVIRKEALREFAEMLAGAAGKAGGTSDDALLRAQLVLAAGIGVALFRRSSGLEPLSSAPTDRLEGPLADLVATLLGLPGGAPEAEPTRAPAPREAPGKAADTGLHS